jgi:hypothetical protein
VGLADNSGLRLSLLGPIREHVHEAHPLPPGVAERLSGDALQAFELLAGLPKLSPS